MSKRPPEGCKVERDGKECLVTSPERGQYHLNGENDMAVRRQGTRPRPQEPPRRAGGCGACKGFNNLGPSPIPGWRGSGYCRPASLCTRSLQMQ